jgi:peroxiredoxin
MIDKRQAKTAPEFSTSDSEGKKIRLSDYRSKKNIMLVFNRGFT